MIRARGFTLIEMAIVLVIITILIGGLAVPLAAQIQARRIAETNKTLEEAKEALIGYAMTHKTAGPTPYPYLPCPDSDGDGVEETRIAGGFCPQNVGWLPWVTLGLAAQDAWGNRLEYAAQPGVTRSDIGFNTTNTLTPATEWHVVCTSETPAICQIAPNVGDIAAQVPVVVLSRGANGWGARNVNGNTLAAPTGAHELSNSDGDESYVSRPPSKADEAAGEFDDLVTWLSFYQLITRVCPSGCP